MTPYSKFLDETLKFFTDISNEVWALEALEAASKMQVDDDEEEEEVAGETGLGEREKDGGGKKESAIGSSSGKEPQESVAHFRMRWMQMNGQERKEWIETAKVSIDITAARTPLCDWAIFIVFD